MALISKKKQMYPLQENLKRYLESYQRKIDLPITYEDLTRYRDSAPVYDKAGQDTLWATAIYSSSERNEIYRGMVNTYAAHKVKGEVELMQHLITDRIDVCTWGNTLPFRVRIVNTLNENFDYFYVKRMDASRIYGLELEHILSPNCIEFLCDEHTLIEEHISGIPGQRFMKDYVDLDRLDGVRIAKEFVKFNERCLIRLLGDMHAGNFVVSVTPDFDETVYRIRPIDFDQQSYEKRCHIYLPQYFKDNNPIIALGMKWMNPKTVEQYREEERTLMRSRARAEHARLEELLSVMATDTIAPYSHVLQLREELCSYHQDERFMIADSMGQLVNLSLDLLRWR